jgi:ferric-dicitrate binding protein FerR (iron transport regulator)
MEYSLPFSDRRKVTLTGEAWFEVARDDKNPFLIIAGDSKIRVLGTKFNVNAYPAEKYVEVVLDEGKVEFSFPGISAPIVMKPDERLVYRNDKVNLSATDASKYAAWVEGKLVFRGDPMAEVARRLERWYNIDVEIVDKDLETYTFRGTLQDDSLEEVLRLLSMTSPIRYRISERKALEDGTFQKEKVMLYRKNIRK